MRGVSALGACGTREKPFTDNFFQMEEKWFLNEEQVSSMEVSCEDCTWHALIPALPLAPSELDKKVPTGKHRLC